MKEKAIVEEACFVFKHSTTCPTSAAAAEEVRALESDIPVYWINVREQRDLSNWFAERYGVTHESPQLVLIREGRAELVWNHHEVNRKNVTASMKKG